MEIKKIDIETLKLKPVKPDMNQRNTRAYPNDLLSLKPSYIITVLFLFCFFILIPWSFNLSLNILIN